jgi:hypothetical protein
MSVEAVPESVDFSLTDVIWRSCRRTIFGTYHGASVEANCEVVGMSVEAVPESVDFLFN